MEPQSGIIIWQTHLTPYPPHKLSFFFEFCAVSPPFPSSSHPPTANLFATLGSILDSQLSWQSCKFKLVLRIMCGVPTPLRTSGQISITWMCGVPPPNIQYEHLSTFLCALSPPYIWAHFHVRCPHPIMNIWAHFYVQCPHPILNIWTHFHVRCPHPIAKLSLSPKLN